VTRQVSGRFSRRSRGAGSAARVSSAGADGDLVDPKRFINRELSWLEFNRRVLHEALDPRTPLLERVGFLSIFTSNLDEFFMKRVGGLRRQMAAGTASRSADGLTAAEQVAAIRQATLPMLHEQARCYRQELVPALRTEGIMLLSWEELTDAERASAPAYFRLNVFPVLTPLAVDPGHPFPFISNLSLSLGVALRAPDREEQLFARVKVPTVLPRWVPLKAIAPTEQPAGQFRFVRLIDLIRHHLDQLFPGMEVLRVMPFRVTRNADLERDEEDAEDLLELVEEELRERRFAQVVRLEHPPDADAEMLRYLIDELELTEQDVYELPGELDYTDLKPMLDLPFPTLKHEPWTPVVPGALADEDTDIFSVVRAGDLLVHHPYESFNASVERFIAAAADDPRVLAIKMTLYRTGDESPFIPSLIHAAETGKQVVCIVEVKARFDEQRNIQVAQMLEKAGVHVVYGIVGLKTHNKTALIVRREPEGLRCYAHIGTGNYHIGTARLYTDLSLFTAKPMVTDEVVELFNNLTGRSLGRKYQKLLIAPINMKESFLEMIRREVIHHSQGKPAQIVAKMNSLQDRQIIAALYEASAAGVPIDLIVRGFCCLRPGVEGLSQKIRVISVIGRFLEHSRIFYFRNGAAEPVEGQFYIGSADWMYRNLHHRIEVVAPIEERPLRERCWQFLQMLLQDQRQAWEMRPDGSYIQRQPADPQAQIGTHRQLMRQAKVRMTSDQIQMTREGIADSVAR
jgi:polyphosphate kinase